MATIDATSTRADIVNAYLDNLSYATDGSTAKANAFREACIALKQGWPSRSQQGSAETDYGINLREIDNELVRVDRWLRARNTARVHHAGFGEFRA